MIEQRLQELAALVAIGAADDAERAELQAAAANDPAVAAELAAWQATGAAFGEALEPMAPPAGGLEALRARIASESQAAPTLSVASPEYAAADKPQIEERGVVGGDGGAEIISLAARRQKRILSSGLALTLAAAAAFLFLWLRERDRAASAIDDAAAVRADRDRAIDAVQKDAQAEIDQLAKDLESSGLRLKTLAASFEPLRSPSLKLATLGTAKSGYAHVFADTSEDGKKSWLVVADALPVLAADKDYQLWFVPPKGNPVSAGLLRSEVEGIMSATIDVPPELVGTRLRPAISLEPRGGSAQPTDVKLIGEPI